MSRPLDWSPLRSRDPVPGDPVAVRALARRWAATAEAARAAADGLRAVSQATTVWRSAAGRAFQDRTSVTAARVARVEGRYDAGAEALAVYARALEQLQDGAAATLLRAQVAQADLDAAGRMRRSAALAGVLAAAANGSAPTPSGEEQRAAAREDEARRRIARADVALQELEAEWHAAGRRAVAALEELDDDGLRDRFAGPLDAVETGTLWLSRASGLAGLAAPLPVVGPAAGTAAIALGGVATVGATVLWANDRATGASVAVTAVSPVAGAVSRLLRVVDAVLPEEALSARPPAPPPSAPSPPTPGRGGTPSAARGPRRGRQAAETVGLASDGVTVSTTAVAVAQERRERRRGVPLER